MTTDLLILDETTRSTGHDGDLDHLFCCCSPDVALCGTNIADEPVAEDYEEQENPCVACADLQPLVCERCGFGPTGPCWCGDCS